MPAAPAARRLRSTVRPSIRGHAAVIAIAFVLSSWLGVIHEATTRHVVCAEHGEMVHAGTGQPDGQVEAIRALERHASAQPGGAVAIQGHDHCAMASTLRDSRLAPRPPMLELAPAAVARLAASIVYDGAARERGVYRTAPKTSPPV